MATTGGAPAEAQASGLAQYWSFCWCAICWDFSDSAICGKSVSLT
jgi:hypothetical protein